MAGGRGLGWALVWALSRLRSDLISTPQPTSHADGCAHRAFNPTLIPLAYPLQCLLKKIQPCSQICCPDPMNRYPLPPTVLSHELLISRALSSIHASFPPPGCLLLFPVFPTLVIKCISFNPQSLPGKRSIISPSYKEEADAQGHYVICPKSQSVEERVIL